MRLKQLTLDDRGLFERHLGERRHELSPYSFPNIYCWKGLFEIRWAVSRGSLCVFFADAVGCFLYLPPLGKGTDPATMAECFEVMDSANRNRSVSRVENVEACELEVLTGMGYSAVRKSQDFIYSRTALAGLRGDAFKTKRSAVNRFLKENRFECRPYEPGLESGCLRLYREWMARRAAANAETVYRGMLGDSLTSLQVLLKDFSRLGLEGLAVLVEGKVKAFTFGCRLNDDTFCIIFETADLGLRGLSQFVFREFCRILEPFRYINAMDDSGLENLARVKRSYRPLAYADAYIVQREK